MIITIVRARRIIPLVVAAVLVLAGGCSDGTTGSASPRTGHQSDSAAPTSSAESELVSVDPCSLLPPEDAETVNASQQPDIDKEVMSARSCVYRIPPNHLLDTRVYEYSFDDMNIDGQVTTIRVGQREAKRIAGNTADACEVLFEVSDNAAMSVNVGTDDVAKSCRIAEKAAPLVEKNLPN